MQLVFQSETQVACAVGVCAAGTIDADAESQFVVCRYSGNNGKGFAYVIGTNLQFFCLLTGYLPVRTLGSRWISNLLVTTNAMLIAISDIYYTLCSLH